MKALLLATLGLFLALCVYAATSYNIAGNGGYQQIDLYGSCRYVINNGSQTVFIPANNVEEWKSVIESTSSQISSFCCGGTKTCI